MTMSRNYKETDAALRERYPSPINDGRGLLTHHIGIAIPVGMRDDLARIAEAMEVSVAELARMALLEKMQRFEAAEATHPLNKCFVDLAHHVMHTVPESPKRNVALRKILESQAAVRDAARAGGNQDHR